MKIICRFCMDVMTTRSHSLGVCENCHGKIGQSAIAQTRPNLYPEIQTQKEIKSAATRNPLETFLFFAWICPVTGLLAGLLISPMLTKWVCAANCLGVVFPLFTFDWFKNDSWQKRLFIFSFGTLYFVTGIAILIYTMATFHTEGYMMSMSDGEFNFARHFMPPLLVANLMIGGIMLLQIRDWKFK